jgi:hypothetical protein
MSKNTLKNSLNIIQCKNILRGARNLPHALSSLRINISGNQYGEIIKWINSNSPIRNKALHQFFPTDFAKLKNTGPFAPIDGVKEFDWTFEYIKPHYKRLEAFIALSQGYQHGLLAEDYQKCKETLDEIEKEFGQSLWLIKNTILLLQASQGLEAQKLYVNKVKANALKSGIAGYIAHYVSIRNESTVTVGNFQETISRHMSSVKIPDDLLIYLKYHLYPSTTLSANEIITILRHENAGCVIDIYETLIYLISVAASNDISTLKSRIAHRTKTLSSTLSDDRLKLAMHELDVVAPINTKNDELVNTAYNLILVGQHKEASALIADKFREGQISIDLIELRIKANAAGNLSQDGEIIGNTILRKLTAVALKSESVNQDTSDLIKIALNCNSCSWAYDLLRVIRQEMTSQVEIAHKALSYFSIFYNRSISPLKINSLFKCSGNSKYVDLYVNLYGSCVGADFCKTTLDHNMQRIQDYSAKSHEAMIITAEIEYSQANYLIAIEMLQHKQKLMNRYYRLRALKIIVNCYLKLGSLKECLYLIADQIIDDPNTYHIMPLEACADAIDKDKFDNLKTEIALSIVYGMYSRFIGSKHDAYRAYAYEDFLLAHNIRKPSQLIHIAGNFTKKHLLYYLKYICIESIMDSSIEFQGSKEIIEERLAVCKLLADLSDQPDEALQTEIKDIIRRLMIQNRMKEIEQSKIYVDIDSIRKTADKTLRESYARYLSMYKYDSSGDEQSLQNKVKNRSSEVDTKEQFVLSLPKNEKNELFVSMLSNIGNEFASSSEHGLDKYLSVRIRHGTLAGQLRSPLENASLITKKNHLTGEYYTNEYWQNKLNMYYDEDRINFNSILTKFSAGFDNLINEICSEWIQVKKDKSDKGLFDFTLTMFNAGYVAQRISEETPFEVFLDTAFASYYLLLEKNLELIRKKIGIDVKDRIYSLLDELEAGLEEIGAYHDIGEINNAIRMVRTEMQLVVNRIVEWFRLSKSNANEPLTLEDALDITAESIKAFAANINIDFKIQEDVPAIFFKGKVLTSFVDIMFIVFENIVRHSGVLLNPNADIKVSYKDSMICINIKNKIVSGAASEIAKKKITSIVSAMAEDNYKLSVKKEGGTGFHKIRKILNHDFNAQASLDFNFIGDLSGPLCQDNTGLRLRG